jgi:general bacterial porin, GBP family
MQHDIEAVTGAYAHHAQGKGMKRQLLLSCLPVAVAGPAQAQSSLTLYGILSQGLRYTSNVEGDPQWQLASGIQQGPRLGLIGQEPLGGGTRAVFTLESGFHLGNGTLGQGGRLFGRQAFVGLASDRFGQLTLGRQIDTMSQSLGRYAAAVQFATYGPSIGDNDNLFATFRVNHAIQYKSVQAAGVQVLMQYALSGAAGKAPGFADFNAAVTYDKGPFSVGAGYHVLDAPGSTVRAVGAVSGDYGFSSPFVMSATGASVSRQRMYGAGASYAMGGIKVSLLYTRTRFDYFDQSSLGLQNYTFTVTDYLTPAFLVGVGYLYTQGHASVGGEKPRWHQIDVGADWFLSKRTDLFLVGIVQRAGGDARFAQIYSTSPSRSRMQTSVALGVRHKF